MTDTLAPGEPVLLYGAGALGAAQARRVRGLGPAGECVVDLKSNRQELIGLPVLSRPDQVDALKAGRPLVIAIFNREVSHARLKPRLAELGFTRVFSFAELGDSYRPPRFWLAPRSFFQNHAREIAALSALLADQASRDTLQGLLKLRLVGDDSEVVCEDRQYFVDGFMDPGRALRWIDCGAYNGDTISAARALGYRIEALAAFEPDPANFAALAKTMDGNAIPGLTAALYPCGVWHRNEYLSFAAGAGEASALSGDGGAERVQCVALDQTVKWCAPNFIKLDVEGAEIDALEGARAIIRQFRPHMAIQRLSPAGRPVANSPADPGYRAFLQFPAAFLHGLFGFDSIVYAVPAAT